MTGFKSLHTKKRYLIFLPVLLLLAGMLLLLIPEDRTPEPTPLELLAPEIRKIQDPAVRQAYQNAWDQFSRYLPGIICWGDSLTAGFGGDGIKYPDALAQKIALRITDPFNALLEENGWSYPLFPYVRALNMGVGGEDSTTILARNGAIPMVIAEDIRIPIMKDYTPVSLISSNGKEVEPLLQGRDGLEYVVLDGVRGYLNLRPAEDGSGENVYCFSRSRRGFPKTIPAGTPVITAASETNLNFIPVIFMGTNMGHESVEELISQHKALIDHQKGNPKDGDQARFIVVGLHINDKETMAPMEKAMEAAFGRQYINLRDYLSTQGLQDAGITPTPKDLEMMEKGMTPASLMVEDQLHFNAEAYLLLGNLIYDRMDELHYFDEADAAMAALTEAVVSAES